jgi:hypothetical protein
MPTVAASEHAPAGEHDCCKNGLQATPPTCCMSAFASEAPARQGVKYVFSVALTVTLSDTPLGSRVATPMRALATGNADHLAQSPPLVLRI